MELSWRQHRVRNSAVMGVVFDITAALDVVSVTRKVEKNNLKFLFCYREALEVPPKKTDSRTTGRLQHTAPARVVSFRKQHALRFCKQAGIGAQQMLKIMKT